MRHAGLLSVRWVRNSYIPALGDITETDASKLEKELVSVLVAAPLMWNTNCLIISLALPENL